MTHTEVADLPATTVAVLEAFADLIFLCNAANHYELQCGGSAMEHACQGMRAAFAALPGVVNEEMVYRLYEGVLDGGRPAQVYERAMRGEL